ncbi:8952_t:CDS:1 [Cetraspora pellucida]|uniref:8952_t:CDS:1 n=1 Tax=Cetraspora pellucida TaxID=1433469 RepID=A0ACA9LUJ7_9GLOM|nr:8952_t:CDS:1 [Cetraspora pellucida]
MATYYSIALYLQVFSFLIIAFGIIKVTTESHKEFNITQLLEIVQTEFDINIVNEGVKRYFTGNKELHELHVWSSSIAKDCIGGNASHVYENLEKKNIEIPDNAIKLASHIKIPDGQEDISGQYIYTASEKQVDIRSANTILDSIYESIDKEVPYFHTEEEFSPYAPRYAPLQIILDSVAIRSTQVVDTYLSSISCTTNNESFHKFADRTIFYNSLSAGLSSAVLNHVSKNTDMKFNILINIMSTVALQIHMVKSIASLANLDTNDDAVRTLIYLCIASDGVKNSMTETTKEFAKTIMLKMISNINESTLAAINKRVAMKLFTKVAENKGIVNFVSVIPFVGESVTLVSDSLTTYSIGKIAKYVFCPFDDDSQDAAKLSSPPSYSGNVEL